MSCKSLNLGILVSGGGTNLQALMDAQNAGFFKSRIRVVISDKNDAYALKRAEKADIPTFCLKEQKDIIKKLQEYDVDLVVLAGYLKILDKDFLKAYNRRIINIHPSLLPKYGGMGMHGTKVHEAVFKAGEKKSGASVHYVTDVVDGGDIILQEKCDISDLKTPAEIQKRLLDIEHGLLKKAVLKLEEEL